MEENISELKKKLVEKLENEFKDYKQDLLTKTPEKILEKSYETTVKQEVIDTFNYDIEYTKEEYEALLNESNLLEKSYDEWLDTDGNLRVELESSIDNLVEDVVENAKKEKAKSKKDKAR